MSRLEFPPGIAKDQTVNSWLCTPKDMMPALVNEYVELIGNSVTNEFCTCEWVIHPDDVDKAEGKRRLRKGEPSPLCWIHSKQGYLLGFFTWLFKVRDKRQEIESPLPEWDGEGMSVFPTLDAPGAQAVIHELPSDEEVMAEQARRDRVRAEQYSHDDETMMVVHGNADQMLEAAQYLRALDKAKSETYKATFVGEHGPEMLPICGHDWPVTSGAPCTYWTPGTHHVCLLTLGHKGIHGCGCGVGCPL